MKKIIIKESQLINITENVIKEQLKDISIYTTSVIINVTVEIYDEDYTKVEDEKEIELMVDDMGGFKSDEPGKWYYEDEKDDEMRYHTILPTNIQVDLEDKSIIVMWN